VPLSPSAQSAPSRVIIISIFARQMNGEYHLQH
jgi:hypothetical protein